MRISDWSSDVCSSDLFVSVGEVDKEAFNSERTLKSLRARIENSVNYFTSYCASRDLAATSYQAYGGDPLGELMSLLPTVFADFPKCVGFSSKLEFEHEMIGRASCRERGCNLV